MTQDTNPLVLDRLVSDAGGTSSFRERSYKVGSVYTLSYSSATIAIYDYDREKAGGLPKGGFLIAAKESNDESFVLLRILGEARLPAAAANDVTREHAVEATANEKPWPETLDAWTKDRLSLHGLECRILGTFLRENGGQWKFAEDTDNYYAVSELMVWKPDATTLELIVNNRHRTNPIPLENADVPIGFTRFAAAEREGAISAQVKLTVTDLLQRRTVYLGMSRSGKSNAMKITAEQIYRLREIDPNLRIGQLIFDPNGEYAQDNPQDGAGLHRIHETLSLERDDEVETFGLFPVPSDPDRKIMKINFYGDQFPSDMSATSVEQALEQLLAGREIIVGLMADVSSQYMRSFRDADLSIPVDFVGDRGVQARYKRTILAYQTALFAAGLQRPNWKPSLRGLFNKDLLDAMTSQTDNAGSSAAGRYASAATTIEAAKDQNGDTSWDALVEIFSALRQFVTDDKSAYQNFNRTYIQSSSSGESWAEPRLANTLQIFQYPNGPRSFQRAQEQHDPSSSNDFAAEVVDHLENGKLVIIDQSTGDPEQNRRAAERIMWRVFNTQQEKFRTAATGGGMDLTSNHLLVYVEEAHNLLPRAGSADSLRTVWARAAKEGSKMNLGMVLATQAPSSIMPEILSETDNWILAYLNSASERRVVGDYMDFGDFLEQIGQVSEPGFVRIRTLSRAYTVPMQFERFRLELPAEPTS